MILNKNVKLHNKIIVLMVNISSGAFKMNVLIKM